jgi:hypothetical protein
MLRLFLLMLAALAPQFATAEAPLLRAEQAFRYTAEARGDELVLRWQVADGYYMYQDRFGFRSLDAGVTLGEPELPAGIFYEDEFFGETYIHRGDFEIRIPFSGAPSGSNPAAGNQVAGLRGHRHLPAAPDLAGRRTSRRDRRGTGRRGPRPSRAARCCRSCPAAAAAHRRNSCIPTRRSAPARP